MIQLGLARITQLLQSRPQPWKAIHVAGTNGKGSTCAYIAALLRASGHSCGVFNSPHFIDRWDCITINNKPVSEKIFLETERLVKERDERKQIGASEFELLTATAFEIMTREKVEFGIIECGMGGALDATNAVKNKAVTVITKIGLDHQSILGNTIEEITVQKAGILRRNVPCVIDCSNKLSVLASVRKCSVAVLAPMKPTDTNQVAKMVGEGFEHHQIQNIATAMSAFRHAVLTVGTPSAISLPEILAAIRETRIPGRLQRIDRNGTKMLLDGAHNVQSAQVLAKYVDKHLRTDGQPVTWVLAASEGKDVSGILEVLLKPNDLVTAVQFGPVDGMPWVRPKDPKEILAAAEACRANTFESEGDIGQVALETAPSKGGPVVVAGSLYLVSDLLRHMRSHNIEP